MSRVYKGEDALETVLVDAAKGERFRSEADAWIDANPQAWAYMTEQALLSAHHRRRFGIGALCEHVRWHMFAKGDEGFKLNNNHRAAFARRLIRENPEIEPYIKVRDSVTDLAE